MIKEKSPYLIQHAYNPVDWYPWGEEAFEQAAILNRPIFLSIGYSTCHWCHVMEQESFEAPEVAEFMNANFVNIKVDREERPDLDAIYMRSVQMMTGQGGWPLSVFLTPNFKPFFGGTYFPPEDRHGIPGLKTVLRIVAQQWKKDREKITNSAEEILKALKETAAFKLLDNSPVPSFDEASRKAFGDLMANYDELNGGFGNAPKFPMATYLNFLLHFYSRTGEKKALHMVETTMNKMISGGIYDQLAGGFSRYSTDAQWTIPHFEKMLYDNAQLIGICATLFQLTRKPIYEAAIRETVDYVTSNLTHPDGGFFSGEDADTDGKEGGFYLWTWGEIKSVLKGPEAEIFIHRFGVTPQGNFFDPQTGDRGNNVLFRANSTPTLAAEFGRPAEEIESILALAKKKLLRARSQRTKPQCDDKILTGWNGLMISSLAKAAGVLIDQNILDLAVKAAGFIKKYLYDEATKTLYKRWRDGDKKILGHLDDFAFLTGGLLDIFEITGDAEWLEWAATLSELQNDLFWDKEKGGYFMTLPHPDLLLRLKDDSDGVIPSGNSAAVLNGFRLARLLDRKDFLQFAKRTLEFFAPILAQSPTSLTTMLTAFNLLNSGDIQIVVIGEPDQPDTKALAEAVYDTFQPGRIVIRVQPGEPQKKLARILSFIENMKQQDNKATAFLCRNFVCEAPTNDPATLAGFLRNNSLRGSD